MNNKKFTTLANYIIEELKRCRHEQSKLSIKDDMFHFYTGACSILKDVLDELCKLGE